MIIKPKIRGFICTTAHPDGCAAHVKEQVDYVKSQPKINGPKKVLVVGSSTGYGLASRIAATFGSGADTIGVFFEKPASGSRTASAGWYNTAAFDRLAAQEGRRAFHLNGDAFSDEMKQQTIELIRQQFGKIDMLVYSLASPRRKHPKTGETFTSVLKPIGQPFTNKTVHSQTGEVSEVTLEPATEEEIRHTVAVMGGEDWKMWIDALVEADVLEDGFKTVAYSYIGPEVTHAVYRDGTIGRAKDDLEQTALELHNHLKPINGEAYVSVNKALVTQSSAAIPVVPLYMSLLFRVMKNQGTHEDCAEQMYRLFAEQLYASGGPKLDDRSRIRLDNLEMQPQVQDEVKRLWEQVNSDNLKSISDFEGYQRDFLKLFGFGLNNVDYEADVDPEVSLQTLDH